MPLLFRQSYCYLFLGLCLSYLSGSAQSIVYYPFNSLLGVSTNPDKNLWLDVKLQTNSYFSSLGTEISPEINLSHRPMAKIFAGAGLKLNYLNAVNNRNILEGFFLNTGLRATPFAKQKQIQIAFELSPYVAKKLDIGVFRSHLGIGYNFSR
jgi:hypothetical protein